jgi:hypothetical protein
VGDWRFVLVNSNDGSNIAGLTAAKTRKVIWYLDAACTASFVLPGTHPQALPILETQTDLKVFDDTGALRFRGRLGSSTDDVSDAGHVCNFSAVDYRGFLDRRTFWPTSTLTFSGVEQVSIAWQIITDTQALAGGDLGITLGSSPATGVVRSAAYPVGTSLGQTLKAIGDVSSGFDWEIDQNLAFNTYFPLRGRNPGLTLAYGAQITSFKRTVDTSTFANAIRYSGDAALIPVVAELGAYGAGGRWELQSGDVTIFDQSTLNAKATYELAKDSALDPSYAVVLKPGWWTPDVLWLGDVATLVLNSGRLAVNNQYRVNQVEVDQGDDGGQIVTLTFGPVVTNPDMRVRDALQRLTQLERR